MSAEGRVGALPRVAFISRPFSALGPHPPALFFGPFFGRAVCLGEGHETPRFPASGPAPDPGSPGCFLRRCAGPPRPFDRRGRRATDGGTPIARRAHARDGGAGRGGPWRAGAH